MLAGLLGVVGVLPGTSHLASSAGIAAFGGDEREPALDEGGRMESTVNALCDCRLVCKGSRLALFSAERVERMDMESAAEE